MDESKYLEDLSAKNEKALSWFIDKYAAYVSAVIRKVTRSMVSEEDIEEAASDVFLALWENAKNVRPEKTKAYLAAVARNKAKMLLRKADITLSIDDDILIIADNDTERKFEEKEQAAFIRKAVLSMKQPVRDIFLRYYFLYQTIEEISFEMNLNYSTVKTHLHRGRARLKEILTEGGFEIED